jgi:hypothetical protein
MHRRSLNSEGIVFLESVLAVDSVGLGERLARARHLRTGLDAAEFQPGDIDSLNRQGRA